jgi:putative phosphoribosyl transferase
MFTNREDAGIRLAGKLTAYKGRDDVLVLALPRGGAVVGFELAQRLGAALDVLIVRKIGVPWQPELAAGAVSETGTVYLNKDVISLAGHLDIYLEQEIKRQKQEIARRVDLYRGGAPIRVLADKTVILVDDGVATGATMKAAIQTLKKEGIARLVVAVPVAPPETAAEIRRMADEFLCLETPDLFMAVGGYYGDFTQVTDEEVVQLLRRAEMLQKGKRAA